MNTELAGRLRRLGLGKGTSSLRPVEQRRQARCVENLLPGRLLPCEDSACFVTERNYPLDWSHGTQSLGSLLDASTKVAATMFREPSLPKLSFRDFVFLDTETTGLSGGTGTIAFLVGVGFFEDSQFVVRQFLICGLLLNFILWHKILVISDMKCLLMRQVSIVLNWIR